MGPARSWHGAHLS